MLKIYQVYYKDEQLDRCQYTPLKNTNCTPYFENSVILNLVTAGECANCDYFGVLSWNLANKVLNQISPAERKNAFNKNVLDWVAGVTPNTDVIGLVKYIPHDPITHFCSVHTALPKYFAAVTAEIGLPTPPLTDIFYNNHFLATPDVYTRYVKEVLYPAMRIMDEMPELWNNSGYPRPLPVELRQKWDINYYPYHTFICERLFSYFVALNKLTVKYY